MEIKMQFVNVRELKVNTSKVLNRVRRGEDIVVTLRGKPEAAVIRLTEEMIEEFLIARNPALRRSIEAAYQEYKRKGGISADEMRRRLAA